MGSLVVLLVGMAIVVGGVLLLRLHAFIALVLAALAVALLTPRAAVVRQAALEQAGKRDVTIRAVASDGRTIELTAPAASTLNPPRPLVLLRPGRDPWSYAVVGHAALNEAPQPAPGEAKGFITNAEVKLEPRFSSVSPADVILPEADFERSLAAGQVGAPERVAAGFGTTAAGIGILVAFASIVGKCLLDSGSADRIVRSSMAITGEGGAPAAFVASGFILGIPVFFDTVFYLMLPLAKALRLRTGRNYLLYILTIVCGATMTHSLVPPTPGPLVAAEMLGVDIGLMILLGCVVGAVASISGYGWAQWINRRVDLPLRQTPDLAPDQLEAIATRHETDLPPLWLALAPIVLPVVLIGGREIVKNLAGIPPAMREGADLLGNKNVALILAAAVAVVTVIRQRRTSLKGLAESMQSALAGAGIIILITAAGGAFGKAIEQTGVATLIGQLPTQSTPALLALAFLVTVAVRTAQGSATVAMITAAGVFAPLATSGHLVFHPVWLALAIGCGSKMIAWMNDSGFWVITQMSGMTEAEGLKYSTPMMIIMGTVGLIVTIAGALVFPLV